MLKSTWSHTFLLHRKVGLVFLLLSRILEKLKILICMWNFPFVSIGVNNYKIWCRPNRTFLWKACTLSLSVWKPWPCTHLLDCIKVSLIDDTSMGAHPYPLSSFLLRCFDSVDECTCSRILAKLASSPSSTLTPPTHIIWWFGFYNRLKPLKFQNIYYLTLSGTLGSFYLGCELIHRCPVKNSFFFF